jgi:cobalt/nickel transport system permease protein
VWAFGLHAAVLGFVIVRAELDPGFVARRMAVEIPFVLFAAFLPFVGPDPRVTVLGVALSGEGLWSAWSILARASLGTGASVVLAATTEVPDILAGLSRLRMPAVLVAIAGFMIRYLDVLAGEFGRMRTAAAVRGYRATGFGSVRVLTGLVGSMLVRAFERGERIHAAMVVRGYRGVMPTPFRATTSSSDWRTGLALPSVALIAAALAVTL